MIGSVSENHRAADEVSYEHMLKNKRRYNFGLGICRAWYFGYPMYCYREWYFETQEMVEKRRDFLPVASGSVKLGLIGVSCWFMGENAGGLTRSKTAQELFILTMITFVVGMVSLFTSLGLIYWLHRPKVKEEIIK